MNFFCFHRPRLAGSIVRPAHVPSALHPCPPRCILAMIMAMIMAMCLCVHTDPYVCVSTQTHVSLCTHIHMCLCVHTDIRVCVFTYYHVYTALGAANMIPGLQIRARMQRGGHGCSAEGTLAGRTMEPASLGRRKQQKSDRFAI